LIEHIQHQGQVYAIVVRWDYEPDGVQFVTSSENSLQVGVLKHPYGAVIKPHFHKSSPKEIKEIQEVLLIQRGKVVAKFYDEQNNEVAHVTLQAGDTVLLLAGGHGFEIIEDTKMIEVKQGPYYGRDQDKELLKA